MKKKFYEGFHSDQVTDEMLEAASRLFSENYGVWSKNAAQSMGKFAQAGSNVRLGKKRLRDEYLPSGISSYVRVTVDDQLAGNAFACRWSVDGKTICWVTQLVVHRDYRERGLATGLLNHLRLDEDDFYGIMSSHPAACLAAAKAYGSSINTVSLEFVKSNAKSIMSASPVSYVQSAQLRGRLFDPEDATGLISGADTGFFVDHEEPLEALEQVQESIEWPLGVAFGLDRIQGAVAFLTIDSRGFSGLKWNGKCKVSEELEALGYDIVALRQFFFEKTMPRHLSHLYGVVGVVVGELD